MAREDLHTVIEILRKGVDGDGAGNSDYEVQNSVVCHKVDGVDVPFKRRLVY